MYDQEGNAIPYEDWEYNNKYFDFKQYQWPKGESSIEFESTLGDGVKIWNYRYPVQVGVQRRGIVFYVHGYGTGLQHMAFLAKMFAHNGYEFCGMDQRGFGQSGGTRGRVESLELAINDLTKFNETYYEKYG